MTTVYLVRHSEPFKEIQGEMKSKDSLQLMNEKYPLGVDGEKLAEKVAKNDEFKNLDVVWTSNYVRAMTTAKYFAYNNGLKVNVDDRLGERIQGITSWDELPEDYYERQFEDENYKFRDGENRSEVTKRMREVLFEILKNNPNKRILIVSHHTAITFLLKSLCEIKINNTIKEKVMSFNGKVFYEGDIYYCEAFKLEFDENLNLCSIKKYKDKKEEV